MKKAGVILVGVLLVFGLVRWCNGVRTVSYGPGIMAPDEPVQVNLSGQPSFIHEGYSITPVADFDVHARVLSRKDYRRDGGAAISPVDLALGWGRMSDEEVYGQLVNVEGPGGFRWRTSTTRTDTGNGACELVFVESFEIVSPDVR